MRILLLGEYSNVHATLALGLRALGHEVVVASNGDFWKDYPRDIDLARRPGKLGGMLLMYRLWRCRHLLKGYDVVQLINPMFVELKSAWCRRLYHWLRRHNGKVVLGAFGMDYYWVHENRTRMPLRYSDFNLGHALRDTADTRREVADWIGTDKGRLSQEITADCDGIVAGLYEYWVTYAPLFANKTRYIPFPITVKSHNSALNTSTINTHAQEETRRGETNKMLKLFIGVSKSRSVYKGTDIMLEAVKVILQRYPDKVEAQVVNGVPFEQYVKLMLSADCILDQLYSYTPAMNALEAMSHGIICIGGGEEEHYALLGEAELRPIINVEPTMQSVIDQLEWLVQHPEKISDLKQQSCAYIARHHDHIKVAQQYVDFWQCLL